MRWAMLALLLAAGGAALAQSDPFVSAPPPRPRPVPAPRPAEQPTPAPAAPAAVPSATGYSVAVGRSFRDCGNCPELVLVPPGSFDMGSSEGEADRRPNEGPQHRVTLAAALAVGKYHVTVGEYRAFTEASGRGDGGSCWSFGANGQWAEQQGRSWRSPGFSQTDRDPVVCVNWEDARAYAAWVSQRTGKGYRLLTEAEFEYAARAGSTTRWWWGEDGAVQCRNANGADQSTQRQVPETSGWTVAPCDDGFAYTAPVGRFAANRFGLYDMAGNALQWVEDCYRDSYAGAPSDASTPATGGDCASRVLRGGSWGNSPQLLRSAVRLRGQPVLRNDFTGFRVARTPGG